ncbi:AAA family ATPase [uncultured Gilvimarinus sp.]|uniref:AAA family ATPase n=1 Tax=uncultured Gilvimarinus sp. TaxID=1689143 RepID=UPI0030D89E0D
MTPEYCERFGLEGDPFANDTFYVTPDLECLADQITHASQFSAGFVVVSGAAGTGKTAFAKFFYAQLIAIQESVLLDVAVASSAHALLLELADFLALPVSADSSMGELLAQLRTIVNGSNEALAVTVVLDNAHLLADDTLAALVSLLQVPAGHSRPFSFVLFSELELAHRLDQFQMPDVAVQDIVFPLMTAPDVTAMLNYRMELAGFLGEPLFSLGKVEQLCQEADGRLDKVLKLAQLDLQGRPSELDAEERANKKSALPVMHIAAVAGLLAALGLVYLYQGDSDGDKSNAVVKRLSVPAEQVVSPKKPAAQSTTQTTSVTTSAMGGSGETGAEVKVRSSAEKASTRMMSVEGSTVIDAPPVPESETDSLSAQDAGDIKTQDSVPKGAESNVVSSVANQVPTSSSAAASVVEWANDEAEILSWPSSAYSLQVLGVSSRDAAKAYVQRQSNSDHLRVMATERSDKPWFIVLEGRYSSLARAKQAASNLPAQQVKAGPWPRKVKELQAELTK